VNRETAHYVLCYFGHLMTKDEHRAHRHLSGTLKATFGRSDAAAQEQAWQAGVFRDMMSENQSVLRLAADGYDAFIERTAERILRDSSDKVRFNLCPKRGELTRTPRAKQCRFCGHDWHGTAAPAS